MIKSRQKKEKAAATNVGAAIFRFRGRSGMTQRQLAESIGVAPGSIYRYEVGSSSPDLTTIRRLMSYAAQLGDSQAVTAFANEIRDRTGLAIDPESPDHGRLTQPVMAILANTKWLTAEQNLLVLAFARLLKDGSDATVHAMVDVLLKPWIADARAEVEKFSRGDYHIEARKSLRPPK